MARTIRQRLDDGELVRVMSVGALPVPKLVELAGLRGDIEGIWVDQEHSAVSHAELELLLMACRATGLDAFARVAPTDYATVMRPFEAGCSGVMLAQVRSSDEVAQALAWTRYAPDGQRGLFLGNFEGLYGTVSAAEHVARANRERWVAVQIETVPALEQVERIAGLAGVDHLFVGPGDLACSLGVPGQPLHARCRDALQAVARAAENAGITWGTLCRDPEHARVCAGLGCRLFSIYGDLDLVHRGYSATRRMFDDLYASP